MKKNLRLLAGAALGVVALSLTSCYYDPYYGGGSTSVSTTYSSGYGDGYGYGGPSFSTSVFVSTGDPRWGYDPNCYSYYDYHSRRYYDPYLNGYYPIGYRPPVVYGVPHPYGWRPGGSYCPPPRGYRNVTVGNYRNRAVAYQGMNYGWAKQVRQQPAGQGRVKGSHPAQGNNGYNGGYNGRPNTGSHSAPNRDVRPNTGSRPTVNRNNGSNYNPRESYNPREANSRPNAQRPGKNNNSLPSRYNTPVNDGRQQVRPNGGYGGNAGQRIQGNRPQQKQNQPNNGGNRQNQNKNEDDKRIRGQRF